MKLTKTGSISNPTHHIQTNNSPKEMLVFFDAAPLPICSSFFVEAGIHAGATTLFPDASHSAVFWIAEKLVGLLIIVLMAKFLSRKGRS